MNRYFTFLIFLISVTSNAQQNKIHFSYDHAGNQIIREYCPSCPARNSNVPPKEIAELKKEDLQKFSPEDVISYYPNPVKEQLYLKWELINNNQVSSINVYSLNGQLIKAFNHLEGKDNYVINFSELTQNVYSLILVYSNGDEKSIKIIKK